VASTASYVLDTRNRVPRTESVERL